MIARSTLSTRTRAMIVAMIVWTHALGDDHAVAIPSGTFRMGTDAADIPALKSRYRVGWSGIFENETPPREVTISAFRIDKHEVTNASFAEFIDAVPDWRKSQLPSDDHNGNYLADWVDDQYPQGRADHPVVYVTWAAAQSYCRWAGGRLPTEAEWEYVARAGGDAEFPWGDDMPSPEDANYSASDIGESTPVGSYPPNEFGVHDLAGNVWEFLLDEWREDLSSVGAEGPVAGGPVADSDISSVRGRRSVRGASFGGSVVNLRTRWRDSHVVTNAVEFVGFRCAYPE